MSGQIQAPLVPYKRDSISTGQIITNGHTGKVGIEENVAVLVTTGSRPQPERALFWLEFYFKYWYYAGFCPFKIVRVRKGESFEYIATSNLLNKLICGFVQSLSFLGLWPTIFCAATGYENERCKQMGLKDWFGQAGGISIHFAVFRMMWMQRQHVLDVLNFYDKNFPGAEEIRANGTSLGKTIKQRICQYLPVFWIYVIYTLLIGSYTLELYVGNDWHWQNFTRSLCEERTRTVFKFADCQLTTWGSILDTVLNFCTTSLNTAGFHVGDTLLVSTAYMYWIMVNQILSYNRASDLHQNLDAYIFFTDNIRILARATGMALMCIIFGSMPFYVAHLPGLMRNLAASNYDIDTLRNLMYYTNFFGGILAIAISFNKIHKSYVYWISQRTTLPLFSSPMEYQSLQSEILSGSALSISPGGTFVINFEFCKAIFSFAATYAILLAQMQILESPQ